MSIAIDPKASLLQITSAHPETIEVFVAHGFPQMEDPEKRRALGRHLTLEQAVKVKGQDLDAVLNLLQQSVSGDAANPDVTLSAGDPISTQSDISILGLLPCPVRLPLMDLFTDQVAQLSQAHDVAIHHEMKAASMGVDWVAEKMADMTTEAVCPDVFISAGFDLFFGANRITEFKAKGVFQDRCSWSRINKTFAAIQPRDPKGHYSMISVVPAVFLVNRDELGERPIPRSWSDLLWGPYDNAVSLPVGDFDLFNAILLNIHKAHGDRGVARLGRILLSSLHPSQMVKTERKKDNRPAITIMPYFFTKMVKDGDVMEAVWPEDGAILSPIFMLTKKRDDPALRAVIDFFFSRQVGTILAEKGLFPSLHPDVANPVPSEAPLMWLGWETIYGIDIQATIDHCLNIFNSESGGQS